MKCESKFYLCVADRKAGYLYFLLATKKYNNDKV